MGQQEVLKLLNRFKGDYLTTKEINDLLRSSSALASLNRLEKEGLVIKIERTKNLSCLWKLK